MSGFSKMALAILSLIAIVALAACGGAATPSPSAAATASPSAASSPSDAASAEPSAEASPSEPAASGAALNQLILQFEAQNDSGITGGAILTELDGGEMAVTIGVVAIGFADPMPAHIHPGTCAELDPTPKYPLNDVAVGSSNTVIETTIDDLTSSPHAINIHKSAAEADVYVACADITR